MIAAERGFLLLCSHLGNPERRPLTDAQLRILAQRVQTMECPQTQRELKLSDLVQLGYGREGAQHILSLLQEEELLSHYLRRAKAADCVPITRVSDGYPARLRQRLGADSPGCLWAKGDRSLLDRPAVSLVGSRNLREANRAFAEAVGVQAAKQGFVLVSGNARGADQAAQNACLQAGGGVISIVPDALAEHPVTDRVLFLSEDGFDEPFSAQRAIGRNRCIHALGTVVFVAQASVGKGGTWDGTMKNLRAGWSSVFCFRDGSEAAEQLAQMGAQPAEMEDLQNFEALFCQDSRIF